MAIDTKHERWSMLTSVAATSGHPTIAQGISELLEHISALESEREHGAGPRLDRLRSIVRYSLDYQTNAEVRRWLEAGLADVHPLYDNRGRQLDAG